MPISDPFHRLKILRNSHTTWLKIYDTSPTPLAERVLRELAADIKTELNILNISNGYKIVEKGVAHIPGFRSLQECQEAGKQTEILVRGTVKESTFICVKQRKK